MKDIYYNDGWLRVLPAISDFYDNYHHYPKNTKEFNKFLNNEYFEKNYIQDYLNIYKYNVLTKNDSFYIYSFGFDNNDDICKKVYHPNNFSFFKSLFLNGDIILLKQEIKKQKDTMDIKRPIQLLSIEAVKQK